MSNSSTSSVVHWALLGCAGYIEMKHNGKPSAQAAFNALCTCSIPGVPWLQQKGGTASQGGAALCKTHADNW